MATSKRRSQDVHETANEVSIDGSRRTQGLETRATTILAELPRHAPLYDKSTARHSTVRTKHTHQVTREVFESKHGRDRANQLKRNRKSTLTIVAEQRHHSLKWEIKSLSDNVNETN